MVGGGSGYRCCVAGCAIALAACDLSGAEVSDNPDPDVTAPDTQITAGPPALGDVAIARFEFTSDDDLADFECRVDDGDFETCSSPTEYSVSQGAHAFEVRAVDGAGNVDQTPAAQWWSYDLDECVLEIHDCHELASCSNLLAGYDCECIAGYAGDGSSCENFDECAAGADTCSVTAQCIDTEGSFACIGDDPLACAWDVAGYADWLADDLGELEEATVELWFKGSWGRLFRLNTYSSCPGVASVLAFLGTAEDLGLDSLSGPVILLKANNTLGGEGEIELRAFAIGPDLGHLDMEQWHHYALVMTASGHRAFVDGVELTEYEQLLGTDPAETFESIFAERPDAFFDTVSLQLGGAAGQLEDFRLSSTARYTGDFLPTYPLELDDDTVALYPLDEGSGTISYDRGPGRRDLEWDASPWGKCTIPSVVYRGQSNQGGCN